MLKDARLPTELELVGMIQGKYGGKAVFPGDWWAPSRDLDGNKDWIQIGDSPWRPGDSHKRDCCGWPGWADKTGWAVVCYIALSAEAT